MLWDVEESHALSVVKVARDCPSISHILFADDTMIFCRAVEKEWRKLIKILGEYEDKLARKGIITKRACLLCSHHNENLIHLLLTCPFSSRLWFSMPWCLLTSGRPWQSFREWWLVISDQFKKQGCLEVTGEIACVLWHLWKQRNSILFEDKGRDMAQLWMDGVQLAKDYVHMNSVVTHHSDEHVTIGENKHYKWRLPR
ncbi:hypothetical protein LIER_43248 [Lithospermum erythrorhizon]|uniref:Reverse transcriptase zinc-binding domain-containing protein n=1 Tax=Lithospermum erythrorhizon TaxID=34254 RepID=A0AAV3PRJ9_LITER